MWWNHLLGEALVLHTRRRTYLFSSSSSSSSSPRAKLQKNHNAAAHQPQALYTKPSPYTPDVSTLSNSMFTSRPPQTAELNSLLSLSLPLSLYLSLSISLPLLTCPSPRPSVRSTISNPIQTPGHTQAAQSNPPRVLFRSVCFQSVPLQHRQKQAGRQDSVPSVRSPQACFLGLREEKGKVCHKTSVLATFFSYVSKFVRSSDTWWWPCVR